MILERESEMNERAWLPKRETESAERNTEMGEREGENLLRNGIKITALSTMSTNRLVIPV